MSGHDQPAGTLLNSEGPDTTRVEATMSLNVLEETEMGAELFYANGRTDMMRLIVALCNFSKASEGQSVNAA